MPSEKISIVIPVYNCEKEIDHTIEAVLICISSYRNSRSANNPASLEVILVDDGSSDRTRDRILKFPTVKYIYQANSGPAAARNRGAKEAQGDILFFTDADCRPQPDWIEKTLSYFSGPDVAVVAGSYGIANPEHKLSRCIHREIIFRHQYLMPHSPSYFGSFNFAIRREVFEKFGGFDTRYRHASGEDNDLSYKISSGGYKIAFAKDALVDHQHPEVLKDYLQQQYRHGFWRVRMYIDHPSMTKGDGYTFWKDIVEIGLVLLLYLSLVMIFTGFFYIAVWSLIFTGSFLLGVNVFFGIRMTGEFKEGLYFADVMTMRAFNRTNGFLSGILYFIGGAKIKNI